MNEAALWFAGLLTLGAVMFFLGRRLGASARSANVTFIVLTIVMIALAWLQRHPATALQLLPSNVLLHLEGTAMFPVAMAALGAAWMRGRLRRQRVITGLAMLIAFACFAHGGRWMLQAPPATPQRNLGGIVEQSTDYSCVAAACATALNELNVPTGEAQMMQLARVRPGSGATMLRALDGLNRRLDGTRWRARIANSDEPLNAPSLVALRLARWNTHLVTILEVRREYVVIADPVDGVIQLPRRVLAEYAAPTAIVFEVVGPTQVALK